MLFHNILRKYTLAILSTFNDLEVEYKLSTGATATRKIPIKYASREKAKLFDEHTTKQLLSGNYNILPRANVALSTMIRSDQRITNKNNKLNTTENATTRDFVYNSIPYEFTYELAIQCRGMNEAGMIIEQITTRFNLNYTLRINEVPGQDEPTSVPLRLLDIAIETEDYESISSNIVTISVGLSLLGNFYPPVRSMEKIKNVDVYTNMWHESAENDFNRAILTGYDVVNSLTDSGTESTLTTLDGKFATIAPQITAIDGLDTVVVGSTIPLEVLFTDLDNKDSELIFVWSVSGSSTITSGNRIAELTGVASETVTVSVVITDVHGNNSGVFNKSIIVT